LQAKASFFPHKLKERSEYGEYETQFQYCTFEAASPYAKKSYRITRKAPFKRIP
jgi:hypothetical protein